MIGITFCYIIYFVGETGLVLVGEHGETGQSGDMLTLNNTNCECTSKFLSSGIKKTSIKA
jgi:hypothetical protein